MKKPDPRTSKAGSAEPGLFSLTDGLSTGRMLEIEFLWTVTTGFEGGWL